MATTKKTTTLKEVTMEHIWKTLSKINVNEHTEEKGTGRRDNDGKPITLTYLSWSHAIAYVRENFPNMKYQFDLFIDSNGNKQFVNMVPNPKGWTGIVGCSVNIEGHVQHMLLPVMTGGMQAVINPTSKDITDTLMRCLTKCLAMFGLGYYIYTGDSLPVSHEDIAPKTTRNTGNNVKKMPRIQPVITKMDHGNLTPEIQE